MTSKFISEELKGYILVSQILSHKLFLGLWGLAIAIYFILRRNPRIKYHLKQFGGPPSYPVVGNVLSFMRPHHEIFPMLDNWVKEYGKIMSAWVGNFHPIVILLEPDAIEKVLSSTEHVEKGKFDYGLLYDWLGWGLITAPKQKWIHTRKLLTPAFHFKILSDFLPVFNKQADILLKCFERDRLDSGKTFDMFPYLTKLTTDIICETAMGKEINAQTSSSNQKYCNAITKYGILLYNKHTQPWLRIPLIYHLTSSYKAEKEYLRTLKELPAKVIEARKLERLQNKQNFDQENNISNETNKDDQVVKSAAKQRAFLDLLLDTSEKNPETFPEKYLQDEVDTFMFAGHDTTSIFFMWALHLLANHPECQQKLQDELDSVFGNKPIGDVTTADISKMKYLECCVKEVLRINPSVPFIMRQINSDIVLKDGKIIPKGCTALVSIYYTHRHPDNFEDPLAFKPERWLDTSVKRHPYSYIPFSAGPRNCIGQKYALMEVKVVLMKLLRTYWIEPVDKLETLTRLPYVVLRCENGVRVKLHKRKFS